MANESSRGGGPRPRRLARSPAPRLGPAAFAYLLNAPAAILIAGLVLYPSWPRDSAGVRPTWSLMGSDLLLTLDTAGHLLKVRTAAQLSVGPGTRLYVRPDSTKIRLFNGDSGEALT